MRVLTVSHFFEGHGGGIERVAGQMCRHFAMLGATAAWAASDVDDPPDFGIETAPLGCANPMERLTGLPMPIPGPAGARRLFKEICASDAILIHDALYATSILALLMAKALRKRVIIIQHIGSIPFSSRFLRGLLSLANLLVTRPMLRAADERVFISDTVRRSLLGARAHRSSELLFNGVDGTIFHVAKGAVVEPAALIGTPVGPRGTRVLFAGRYVEKKGLEVLRAVAELRPDLCFFLVGAGPIRPTEWGLPNVRDLGPQSQVMLAELYRWADLLLLPSVGEGYPLVIQEAMACGLPVVCGSPAERADPDAARWLRGVPIDLSRPKESARRCAAVIAGLNFSARDRAEMARYARDRYDWGKMAQRLLDLAERKPAAAAQAGL